MPVAKQNPTEFTPDPQQALALDHIHGPMLVIAGAGTGKTTVLTQRIARLLEAGHATSEEILALTYTVNSAAEMARRVALACSSAQQMQAHTFHDYCFALLKRHDRGFQVLDDTDLNILLRKRIRQLNLKHYVRAAKVGQFLKDLLEFMRGRWHGTRGSEKIIFASDYPLLDLPKTTAAARALALPDADLRRVLYENAQNLLFNP